MDHSSQKWLSYERDTRRRYEDEGVARAYHEQFAARLSVRRLSHVLVARAEQRTVRRLLEGVRSNVTKVADLPCGTGKLLPVFEDLSLGVVSGDVSIAMMRIARAGSNNRSQPSAFVRLDITYLPFRAEAFDAVVCLRLLHRIPDEVKILALRELFRVTRRYAIVSYGVTSMWQMVRQWLRALIAAGSTVPFPIPTARVADFFEALNWRVVKRSTPLPILSAEEMVLLVKPGQRSETGLW